MLVVTTPPSSTNLVTTIDVELELNDLPSFDSNFAFNYIIPSASAAIANYCNRDFALTGYTETFRTRPPGGYSSTAQAKLMLSRCPVVTVTSITEGTDSPLVAGTDYEFDTETGFVYRLNGADSRRDWTAPKITVVYTAGFVLPSESGGSYLTTTSTLPDDVWRAAILLCRDWYLARSRDVTMRSITLDGAAVTLGTGNPGTVLPAHVEALLSPWKLAVL
ncbi:MAG: hypothetical protein WCJ64_00900 [Rhodospirillaceae bacterium]